MVHPRQLSPDDITLRYIGNEAAGARPRTAGTMGIGALWRRLAGGKPPAGAGHAPVGTRLFATREKLGARALRRGLLTADQLDQALAEQATLAARGEAVRLGVLLQRSGVLSAPQLAQLLADEAPGYRVTTDAARLATTLQQALAKGLRTIMFAGVSQRHASDIVAAGVGVALALMELGTVAIVDFDFQRPSLHDLFGLEPAPGSLAVLSGKVAAGDALRPSGLPGLGLLPTESDRIIPGGELLDQAGRSRVREINALRRVVIFSAPPVLASAETLMLASLVDAVVLVTETDVGQAAELAEAERLLQSVGAQTLGVVLSRQGN